MKKFKSSFILLALPAAGLFSFAILQAGGTIKGTVSPSDAAKKVLAVSSKDTLRTDISNGGFEFKNVKAGSYTLIIQPAVPYKTLSKDHVMVTDGHNTELGEIKLEK